MVLTWPVFITNSPLEQFLAKPILILIGDSVYYSLTIGSVFLILIFLNLIFFLYTSFEMYTIPGRFYIVLVKFYEYCLSIHLDIIKKEGPLYFSLIFWTFLSIMIVNTYGMIPLTYAITSNFVITLGISMALFLGLLKTSAYENRKLALRVILHCGTLVSLAFLVVTVEFISFSFRPFSLGIRLFANMLAGHILVKIFIGFFSIIAFQTYHWYGLQYITVYFLLLINLILFGLELLICFLQAYIYTLLTCMYIDDIINIH